MLKPTEAQFRQTVVDLAEWCGWFAYGIKRTDLALLVSASGIGFPDLCLLRAPRFLVVELKGERGRLTADQRRWGEALKAAGMEYHLWTPSDWPHIETLLTRKSPQPQTNGRKQIDDRQRGTLLSAGTHVRRRIRGSDQGAHTH